MQKQIEKIDNTLITTSIAILAAYTVIYSSNTSLNLFFSIATIFSIVFFVFCLLSTLYGKYRESLRKSIFDNQKEKWAKDLDIDLDKIMEEFVAPQLMKVVKLLLDKKENKEILVTNPEKFNSILSDEWKAWSKDFEFPRKIFAENQVLKIQRMLDDSFRGPLKEKNAIIKYQLERFADKRYTFFVLGLIAFIVSVGVKLFY